jgi:hypothetical protein
MTTAERIAEQFFNNGLKFEDGDGNSLQEVCDEASVSRHKGRHVADGRLDEYETVSWGESIYDAVRYEFADGSAIAIAGDAWDIEGEEPFSWAGA